MNQLHLPDISEFQPNVDWAQVTATNGGAAIIRAAYGDAHIDHAWYNGARRADAHAKGIRVLGIYQYLVQSQDPVAQANVLVNLVGTLQPGEFIICDLEEGSGNQLPRWQAWQETVNAKLNYPGYQGAWLYPGWPGFCVDHNLVSVMESPVHTWIADYTTVEPGDPSMAHTLWQHSSTIQWPGIGVCDCSIFDGTLDELEAKVWTAPTTPAPAPVAKPVVHVAVPSPSAAKLELAANYCNARHIYLRLEPHGQTLDHGWVVAAIQTFLHLTCDGLLGPKTDARIKEFQKVSRITVDGVVGPATWSALIVAAKSGKPLVL